MVLPDGHNDPKLGEETIYIACSQTVGKRILVGETKTVVPLPTTVGSAPVAATPLPAPAAASTFSQFQTAEIWAVPCTTDWGIATQGQGVPDHQVSGICCAQLFQARSLLRDSRKGGLGTALLSCV